jgi:hypothetical protein
LALYHPRYGDHRVKGIEKGGHPLLTPGLAAWRFIIQGMETTEMKG